MGGHHHHPVDFSPANGSEERQARYQQVKKVTLVGLIVNAILAVGKISLGFVGQSQALVADGVHSMADLVSDVIVLVAAKEASKEADEEHPYGHGRIETVVEVLLGALLIIVAVGIMIDAGLRLFEPDRLLSPTWLALLAAFISIVANESLFHYTLGVSKKINSNLLKANAWHHRADAISSVIALVGIAGAMLGWGFLDAIAAIGVSLLVAKIGWDIGWRGLQELIDTALDPEKVEEIRAKILSVDGVKAVHSLRTRSMGGYALVDAHILVVNSKMSVSEGHQISECVMRRLHAEVDEVSDVIVHIDPEDDETERPSGHLRLRNEVEAHLEELFADNVFFAKRKGIVLHYLSGKVIVDINLPLDLLAEASVTEIKKSFELADRDADYIGQVDVHFN